MPKYRKKVIYGKIRRRIGEVLRELCRQKGVELEEGNALSDHIHMLLSVPPKYSIVMTIGYLKSKSAIRIHRQVLKQKGTLFGRSFWARGYCVSPDIYIFKVGDDYEIVQNEDGLPKLRINCEVQSHNY